MCGVNRFVFFLSISLLFHQPINIHFLILSVFFLQKRFNYIIILYFYLNKKFLFSFCLIFLYKKDLPDSFNTIIKFAFLLEIYINAKVVRLTKHKKKIINHKSNYKL